MKLKLDYKINWLRFKKDQRIFFILSAEYTFFHMTMTIKESKKTLSFFGSRNDTRHRQRKKERKINMKVKQKIVHAFFSEF